MAAASSLLNGFTADVEAPEAVEMGPTRPFENADVPQPHPKDQPENARRALAKAFEERKQMGHPSLFLSLLDVGKDSLLYSALLLSLDIAFQFVQPLMIENLIRYVQSSGAG